MKITKKAFIEAMVGNLTIFCGITRTICGDTERVPSESDACYLTKKYVDNAMYYEPRRCVARSRDLKFSNGDGDSSYLDFNQVGSYEFHKYEFPEGIMYVCCHKYAKDCVNAMYYFVESEED